ncbi:chromosome segregation protein SMC [Methanogenium organophilum]|uniref:Chromosome partition protein Smc n=1 Tax=Methanogenium organophilum TaxID=2199 RepID=A0A9X9T830_METOG|nr:chromosome segregation protein SMC [Methanogenium organophilum]WAI01300.1 chromosome segregation protein SMC [Methanogenium organophilum]
MYITELEIDNFKSFGRKTKIPFFEGFTVISGPNGSGKSNIIDSILFCLALSSARGLRAEKLTDLLNVNTGKNTAEVAITFSDDTKIRRRIKKTAHGYYSYNYLNDRLCKQGEIVEFLAKYGIKAEGYNVVMQGDVTRITEMTDNERRKIIDEIAGVSEFDKKKDQALGELEVVRERIEREELVLTELIRRLSELETEREQAIRYRELQEKLDELRGCRSAALLNERNRELVSLNEIVCSHENELGQTGERRGLAIGDAEEIQKKISEISEEINRKTGREYLEILESIESAKGNIRSLTESIERNNIEKKENLETLQSIYTNSKRAETSIKERSDEIRDLSIDRSNLNMDLSRLQGEREKIEASLSAESGEVSDARDQLFAYQTSVGELKEARSDLIGERDRMIERSRFRTSENERLNRRVEQIKSEQYDKENQCSQYESLIKKIDSQKSAVQERIARTEALLMKNRSAQERLRRDIQSKEREIMRMEAQQQAAGGAGGRALEAILGMDGVYGTVAQLGKAPPEYATALDIAAGGRLNYVVVETDAVASSAISFLKENRLGRMTFLPLNKLKRQSLPPLKRSSSAVIDYAENLLDFDPLFEPVFRQVFSGTVLVDHLENARRMIGSYRMVTLEGELLEKGGAMTGGSRKQRSGGFGVAVGEEIQKLEGELLGLRSEYNDIEAAVSRYSDEAESARRERSAADDELARYHMLYDEYQNRIASLSEELDGIIHSQQDPSDESKEGGRGLAEIEQEIEEKNAQITQVARDIEELKTRLNATNIPALSEERERLSRECSDLERRLKNKEADIHDKQLERQHFRNRLDEFTGQREGIEKRNAFIDDENNNANLEISEKNGEIDMLEQRKQSFSDEISGLQKEHDRLSDDLHAVERRILEIDTEIEKIRLQISSLNERKIAVLQEIASLKQEVGDRETDMTLQEIERGIDSAERAMKRIGAVNMLAIEEYDRVDKRVHERTEKKEVLSNERTLLIERIDHYAKMKYDAFMEAYTAIDTNFRRIFAELTRGSGQLVLDNEDDPFAGGMTFAVQPQGKKVHLLNSLSGGEKSLTTLSFIFSIQQYMPAPFYALDEIDMMLDGSNVERVSTMIQELSTGAQSICVSLRKPTIERADRIIGVTARPDKSTYVTGVKSNA